MTHTNNTQGMDVDITIILATIDFPASRDDLVDAARDADAGNDIIVLFQSLPDRQFQSQEDVLREINDTRRQEGKGGRA